MAREGAIIVLLVGCIFLLLALFSFQPSDPGWSQRGPQTDVANWMGPFGAWLANVLYSLFGASALWWPGLLGFAAWCLVRTRKMQLEWDATTMAVRLGGLMLLLLGTTTLGALHFYQPPGEATLPYAAGGILGEGLVGALVPLVDSGGTGLLAVAAMLCGFPLFSGVSWFTVMDELGHRALRLWRWVASPFGLSRDHSESHWDNEDRLPEESGAEEETPETSPATSRRGWRFWRRREKAAIAAEAPHEQEPGVSFAGDGGTDIPWDVPERTPSAKRPEAAYTAQGDQTPPVPFAAVDPAPVTAAALKANRHEEPPLNNAMALRATDTQDTPAPPEIRLAEQPGAMTTASAQHADADESEGGQEKTPPIGSRREPELGVLQPEEPDGDHEPRLNWSDLDRDESERQATPATYADQAEGLRTWRESTNEPDVPAVSEQSETEERRATAEQARAAAAEPDTPTLWTVEHLQSQRPVFDDMSEPDGELPSLRLLTPPEPHHQNYTEQQLIDMAELLETRLHEYGVKAEVVHTWPGPVITRFEIKPAAGVKVSKISNLAKDLARSLMVKSVRVVEVIPGRPTVGIEIPNPHRAMIRLREVIDSERYQQEGSALTLALGQDIGGGPVVANLGKMPHLLVAGTTGSGKSVGVNAMLISMLLKATPEELRLIMVDPKMLELSVYDGIPHLLAPVVTDMKEAANALRWCVAEMERRYKLMAAMGVRNIAGFNGKLDEAERAGAQVADPLWEPQPW
ncbi:MAG: DNA translocase FtsK, partial [Halomonadaceae bacterium]|nr:DNA translocase FtsK [Halomonadaceae bacterium]